MSEATEQPTPRRRRKRVEPGRSTVVLGVRMTPGELAVLAKRAHIAGLTKAGYIAEVLGQTVGPGRRRPAADIEALGRALAALGSIGSNLNQIARSVNANQRIGQDAAATLRDVREVADSIMGAMGKRRRS